MDNRSCITNSQWERYSNKTLGGPEMHYMQEHVAVCEVCADIKEGIDAMQDPGTLSKRVETINRTADEIIAGRQKNRSFFLYWSAAAMIVLGISISWFLINKKEVIADNNKTHTTTTEPAISKNQENAQFKSDPHTPDAAKPPENNSKDLAPVEETPVYKPSEQERLRTVNTDDVITEDTKAIKNKDEATEFIPTTPPTVRHMDTVAVSIVTTQGELMDDYDKTALDSTYKRKGDYVVNEKIPSKEIQVTKTESKKRAKVQRETYPASANNANNSRRSDLENNNYYNSIPAVDLNAIDSADYRVAVRNYDSAYYDKCLVNLYYITINPNSNYYEQGLLLRAKALIKLNKKEDAKVALNTVILLNRSKRKEASDLLNTIK